MKRILRRSYILVNSLLLFVSMTIIFPLIAFAGGGHEESGQFEHIISLEGKTGISLFLSELYNNQRFLYALLVTVTMAVLGVVVALLTELFIKIFGHQKH